jgi:hypothetical protein
VATMELCSWRPWLQRLRSRVQSGEEARERSGEAPLCCSGFANTGGGKDAWQCSGGVAHAWRPHPDERRPLRHSAEQVAGDEVVDVGHVFGLVTGCFREWAKKQNWSPHEALQI